MGGSPTRTEAVDNQPLCLRAFLAVGPGQAVLRASVPETTACRREDAEAIPPKGSGEFPPFPDGGLHRGSSLRIPCVSARVCYRDAGETQTTLKEFTTSAVSALAWYRLPGSSDSVAEDCPLPVMENQRPFRFGWNSRQRGRGRLQPAGRAGCELRTRSAAPIYRDRQCRPFLLCGVSLKATPTRNRPAACRHFPAALVNGRERSRHRSEAPVANVHRPTVQAGL